MVFARSGQPQLQSPADGATEVSGELRAYCEWSEQMVAPRPEETCAAETHVSLDFDDEDAAWSALIAHARALANF